MGSRAAEGDEDNVQRSLLRRILQKGFHLLVVIVVGTHIKDTQVRWTPYLAALRKRGQKTVGIARPVPAGRCTQQSGAANCHLPKPPWTVSRGKQINKLSLPIARPAGDTLPRACCSPCEARAGVADRLVTREPRRPFSRVTPCLCCCRSAASSCSRGRRPLLCSRRCTSSAGPSTWS